MSNRVTLDEHPSRNESGGPLFPELRSIKLDGKTIGYTGNPPYHRVSIIDHWAGTEDWIMTQVKILVEAEFKIKPDMISVVPEPPDMPTDDTDGDGDES